MENSQNGKDDNDKKKGFGKNQIPKFTRKQNIILYSGILLIYLIIFLIYYFFLKDRFPKPTLPSLDDSI